MNISKKKILRDIDDIKMWFYLIPHKKLAVDTETTGLDCHTLELVGISLYNGEYACYIDLYENPDFDIIIKFLIEQFKTVEKVIAHNVKFDYMVLYKYNLYLPEKRFCTQVAAHLLNENVRKSLKFLAQRFEFTEGNIEFEEAVADGYQSEKFYEYAMNDAIWCWKLHEIEQPKLIEEGLWDLFWKIEMPFTETLAHVEMNGILVDKKEIANLGENTCEKLIDMEKRLFDIAEVPEKERSGFNLNSGPTIIKLLTQKFGLTIKEKTKKGKLSVGKATLERLSKQHEFPKLLLEYRKARKLQTAFVNPISSFINDDGRIRPHYNPTGPVTGRLSASKPNVQQSGKDDGYRNIFVAEEGKKLLSADYAGQELRWLAIQSKDKNLLDAFNNDKDLHLATANKVFNLGTPDECLYRTHPEYESYKEKYKDERYKGKNSVNFPVIYGSTEYGISKSLKISEAKAKKIIDDYYELYPGVKVAISACVNHLYKKRYVKDFFGRRRRFQYIDDKVKRQAFNFLIQAPSASQLKVAANRVHKEIPEVKIIMLIHDEIVMEVDKDFNREGDVVKIMKEAVLADIPFEVETTEGLNFGGLK